MLIKSIHIYYSSQSQTGLTFTDTREICKALILLESCLWVFPEFLIFRITHTKCIADVRRTFFEPAQVILSDRLASADSSGVL